MAAHTCNPSTQEDCCESDPGWYELQYCQDLKKQKQNQSGERGWEGSLAPAHTQQAQGMAV